MTEVISVISGKGGVGKTTITANLADGITKQGKSVLVIDANISGANLGLHLNMLESKYDVNSVISGKNTIDKAISIHPNGFHVMPAALNYASTNMRGFDQIIAEKIGHYDFILIDTAAGADNEVKTAIAASDSVLIVTNPDIPSVSNAALVKRLADNLGKPVKGIVLNRARGEYLELSDKDIVNYMGADIISKVQNHKDMKHSIVFGKSILDYSPKSQPAKEISKLSMNLCGIEPDQNKFFKAISSQIQRFKH